ncbi:RNA-binding protein 14-like isoform X5 [Varanus komodoensis]|uniref:RNA-binding protein 14-like isoform X5 n=1 Tax=Varanus komodoensis TaxID=61221 RepID=UPI001CF7CCD6|nr:RNA-binding protein 14-like isoform X5 [Varanus komodoensis]
MHPGVKVFVGNVPEETSQVELRDLFEAAEPGAVLKVALMKQFAFVHMRDEAAADRAIGKLNGHLLHGHRVVVEHSRPRPTHTVKIFVGNVSAACTSGELRVLFQEFGSVVECDIVKAFLSCSSAEKASRPACVQSIKTRMFLLLGLQDMAWHGTKLNKFGEGRGGKVSGLPNSC